MKAKAIMLGQRWYNPDTKRMVLVVGYNAVQRIVVIMGATSMRQMGEDTFRRRHIFIKKGR